MRTLWKHDALGARGRMVGLYDLREYMERQGDATVTAKEFAKAMARTGLHPDTYPDYWKCRICDTKEPHVHRVHSLKYNTWFDEDHGYDSRDEEPQP